MSDKYCILQDDLKDCGVCALLSIIKYYHGDVSKEYLRELTKTTKNGVNAVNIMRTARELGFESFGVKASLKDVDNNYLPIIAHVTVDKKFNHFVVIYKIDKDKNEILVMDPSKGYVKMSFSNFMNISTGYYIVLKRKNVIPKIVSDNNFFSDIKAIIKKYKIVIIIIIFISCLYTFLNILSSYQFKIFLDEISITSKNYLIIIFFLLAFLIFFKYLMDLFRNLLINSLNFIIDKSLVYKAFNHIINLPYLYYKNHTNGDLLTRINDLGNIKELINNFFVSIFVDLFFAIIIFVVMLNINRLLTIIVVIGLILYFLISLISNRMIKKNIREQYEKNSIVNNYLIESLSSFETIKNFSLQKYITRKFQEKYQDCNFVLGKLLKKYNTENFVKKNVLYLSNLVVLYMGVLYLREEHITMTSLITFITLSNYLVEPVRNILDLELFFQNTKESIRRIREIYSIPKEQLLLNKKTNIKYLQGRIDIDHVSYSYNGVDKIIHDVTMSIKEGTKVLIYGNSGCGKSTLMELLIKYLDNNYEGNITIDGYDLKDLDTYTLRNSICYVSQNEYLYTDSLYENITLGKRVSYKFFLEICKNLFISDIIQNSSLGYNYLIENNGENLSGGERMRIIIARSIFKKSNIYIYDETFSQLDVMRERKILEYLFNLMKDKTFIVISHRQSNLDLFNQIINLGDDYA